MPLTKIQRQIRRRAFLNDSTYHNAVDTIAAMISNGTIPGGPTLFEIGRELVLNGTCTLRLSGVTVEAAARGWIIDGSVNQQRVLMDDPDKESVQEPKGPSRTNRFDLACGRTPPEPPPETHKSASVPEDSTAGLETPFNTGIQSNQVNLNGRMYSAEAIRNAFDQVNSTIQRGEVNSVCGRSSRSGIPCEHLGSVTVVGMGTVALADAPSHYHGMQALSVPNALVDSIVEAEDQRVLDLMNQITRDAHLIPDPQEPQPKQERSKPLDEPWRRNRQRMPWDGKRKRR